MDGARNSRPLSDRQGDQASAIFNLVAPLPHEGTDMRITDTAGSSQVRSGAVSPLICSDGRRGDVDSANGRSTPRTLTMPGFRTSTTATRTTTTRTTTIERGLSAGQSERHHADFSFQELVRAYFDCRRAKRNTKSALLFEVNLERNLCRLFEELQAGSYVPGRSICFVITHPKPREVWAADFRDRIVHHLLYNRVAPRFYAGFIADSCACIPGRGTLYAVRRLESKIRSITQNWSRPAFYLKCDLANFFVSIDKRILRDLLAVRIHEPWWLALAELILFHDPRLDAVIHSQPAMLALIPPHKSLFNQPRERGLPIGNLSSQFFANVFMDVLDQHCKHTLGARHYIRYVDDFVILDESVEWLNYVRADLDLFLPSRLGVQLNPRKTVLQPVSRGIDFVGQIIKPWRRTTRRRTLNEALRRVATIGQGDLYETANSYFGLFGQATASHGERAYLAKVVRSRGFTVNGQFTKTYRRGAPS